MLEKYVCTWSLKFTKVILQKSIVEMDTLYKMTLIWEQSGQATDHNIFAFILDFCFRNSVLALTAVAVVEKSIGKERDFFTSSLILVLL